MSGQSQGLAGVQKLDVDVVVILRLAVPRKCHLFSVRREGGLSHLPVKTGEAHYPERGRGRLRSGETPDRGATG
jgi:hypothetical protein